MGFSFSVSFLVVYISEYTTRERTMKLSFFSSPRWFNESRNSQSYDVRRELFTYWRCSSLKKGHVSGINEKGKKKEKREQHRCSSYKSTDSIVHYYSSPSILFLSLHVFLFRRTSTMGGRSSKKLFTEWDLIQFSNITGEYSTIFFPIFLKKFSQ